MRVARFVSEIWIQNRPIINTCVHSVDPRFDPNIDVAVVRAWEMMMAERSGKSEEIVGRGETLSCHRHMSFCDPDFDRADEAAARFDYQNELLL